MQLCSQSCNPLCKKGKCLSRTGPPRATTGPRAARAHGPPSPPIFATWVTFPHDSEQLIVLLSLERDIARKVDLQDVINTFAERKARKAILSDS